MANTNASVKKKNTRNTVLRVLLYVVIIAICLIPSTVSFFVAVCMIVTPPVLSDSFSFFLKDTPII